jgi:hypothetical protein
MQVVAVVLDNCATFSKLRETKIAYEIYEQNGLVSGISNNAMSDIVFE